MEKYLHIVSFNIPYPANYGGVIDVFYKLKALNNQGVKIILHCFEYGRIPSKELENICHKVFYYSRKKRISKAFSDLPFIVNTRANIELLENLLKDNFPILFEGLHTTYFLNNENLKNRLKIVRTHNIEHDYYFQLYINESNILKKIFFKSESQKLKLYEKQLKFANYIASISSNENLYFNDLYHNSFYLPAFNHDEKIISKTGFGKYILYHGNLAVNENIQAVKYLAENVFNNINYKIFIAGNNPSKSLIKLLSNNKNITVIKNPDNEKMEQMISDAHINILLSFQETGIKLKLLSSLFKGRHCIVNRTMVNNTNLEDLCYIKESPQDIIKTINDLMEIEFNPEDILKRKETLEKYYSNNNNIKLLTSKLFPENE